VALYLAQEALLSLLSEIAGLFTRVGDTLPDTLTGKNQFSLMDALLRGDREAEERLRGPRNGIPGSWGDRRRDEELRTGQRDRSGGFF